MACGPFVPGPAEIAVGAGAGKTLVFFGHTKEGVRSREEFFTSNVQADYAGSSGMPADVRADGKIMILTMQMYRFDPAVLLALKARFFQGTPGGVGANEVGTLILNESQDIPVVVRSRYVAKTQYTGYEPGVRLLHAYLSGVADWDYSAREQTVNLTFTGLTKMNPSTLIGECWNTDVTGFPAVT